MIDTCVFITAAVGKEIIESVIAHSVIKSAFDCKEDQLMYEIVTCDLRNSADSRISITLLDKKWTKEVGEMIPSKKDCEYHLKIECSIHKQMLGHNCFGGSSDFSALTRWLYFKLWDLLGVQLPDYNYWLAYRIDVAEVYNLGSKEAVQDWFRLISNAKMSRREGKEYTYGDTGFYVPGESTTVKMYHKGTEFRKHDKGRCKRFYTENDLALLMAMASKLLRVEVEIKPRKLKYDSFNNWCNENLLSIKRPDDFKGRLPFVSEITNEYLKTVHDAEILKILKGFGDSMKACRTKDAVEQLLFEKYKPLKAGKLLGFWFRLASDGEKKIKNSMAEPTFHRWKNDLLAAGCTWLATDVVIAETKVPLDFKPMRTDRHWFGQTLEAVQQMLDSVA